MKIAIISFTLQGGNLANLIAEKLKNIGCSCRAFGLKRYADNLNQETFDNLDRWTENAFTTANALLFIGACGIAVRAIAPYIKDKLSDPAVLVIDELGHFVIPILSGHVGGANDLARHLAIKINGTAVISTATDGRGLFSVDQWAVKNNLVILERAQAKAVSSQLLAGKKVAMVSDFPVKGRLPKGVMEDQSGVWPPTGPPEVGFIVTLDPKNNPFSKTLHLIPKILILGIGCRKGASKENIARAVVEVMKDNQISFNAVKAICSIELKSKEAGLLAFCQERQLPFKTYSATELKAVKAVCSTSEFVKEITGVDNVCERAAILGSGGRLLVCKQKKYQVTIAVAIEPYSLSFDIK